MRNMPEKVIIDLDNDESVEGFLWENERVPLDCVKDNFYRYSIRHDDEGRAATLETFVGVNHYGDFVTSKKIELENSPSSYRTIEGIIRDTDNN